MKQVSNVPLTQNTSHQLQDPQYESSQCSLSNLVSIVSETLWILANTSFIRGLFACCAWVKASNVTRSVTSNIN